MEKNNKPYGRIFLWAAIVLAIAAVIGIVLWLAGSGRQQPEQEPTVYTETQAAVVPAATAAAAQPQQTDANAGVRRVAMITDGGSMDAASVNQACWKGIEAWCSANGTDCVCYQPQEDSVDAHVFSIAQAIAEGADVVVLPGYLFGPALAAVMEVYPDVRFIAVDMDGTELTLDYEVIYEPLENVACLTFAQEQAGYLAGYAAVREGYTKLGFLGHMAVPGVIRYGFGFIQGADAAAAELETSVEIRYAYGGWYFGDADAAAKAEEWYASGTEVIFACGGGIYLPVVEAAKASGQKVIGCDLDQSSLDGCIVTSAVKELGNAAELVLQAAWDGNWQVYGGKVTTLGLTDGPYVGLPVREESWRLENFTVDAYGAAAERIAQGLVTVDSNEDDTRKPEVSEYTTVQYE